jgi:hypothetical protein
VRGVLTYLTSTTLWAQKSLDRGLRLPTGAPRRGPKRPPGVLPPTRRRAIPVECDFRLDAVLRETAFPFPAPAGPSCDPFATVPTVADRVLDRVRPACPGPSGELLAVVPTDAVGSLPTLPPRLRFSADWRRGVGVALYPVELCRALMQFLMRMICR